MNAALSTFKEMRKMQCTPDIITYNTLVHGFSELGDVVKAKAILGERGALMTPYYVPQQGLKMHHRFTGDMILT